MPGFIKTVFIEEEHELGQTSGAGKGQGAWYASVPGVIKSQHNWSTEQQES